MDNDIYIVTGASSGIGKEIVSGLIEKNLHVVMICRDPYKGEAAREAIIKKTGFNKMDLLISDFSSFTSIHEVAEKIHNKYAGIKALINNAGTALATREITVDGFEKTLQTNYLAPFLLTRLLLDLLIKDAPSRIINVSSGIYSWGKSDLSDLNFVNHPYSFMQAYGQSKMMLTVMTYELARRLKENGVTVNCIHPGAVKTNLGHSDNQSLWTKLMVRFIKLFFISPQSAANALVYLATAPELADVTGHYFFKTKPQETNALSHDPVFTKAVWDLSLKLTHVPDVIEENYE